MLSLRRALGTTVLAVGLLGMPSTASADVVFPPPKECPVGSTGQECHGPDLCQLSTCTNERDCAPGFACMEAQLCVRTINCGGMGNQPEQNVEGPCDGAGGCESEIASCEAHMVCVPAGGDSTAGGGTSTNGTTGGSNSGGSNGGSGNAGSSNGGSGNGGSGNGGSNGGTNNGSNDGGGSGGSSSGGGCGCRAEPGPGWLGGVLVLMVGASRRRRRR